jgi:hypothetical protein
MTDRCSKCNKFVSENKSEVVDGKIVHQRGTGCRKDEPLLTVTEVPQPPMVVKTFDKSQIATVHTGPINGLAAALMKSGVVRLRQGA